jgi:vancomycin resistance protein VanW
MPLASSTAVWNDRRDPLLPAKIAVHRALRSARWTWESARYATRRRRTVRADGVIAEGRARLEMAEGQIRNLEIAAACLDGVAIQPGETLSFWYVVGEPTAARGFRNGMELRSGCIVPSIGGGLGPLASALFEVALRAGLTIREHHPHSLELAPESERIRPFGIGAAVLYPYRDVQVKNDGEQTVLLEARGEGDALVCRLRAAVVPAAEIGLEERGYRTTRASGRLVRAGELWQVARDRATGRTLWERLVYAGEAPLMDQMPDHHCYTWDRVCPNAVRRDDVEARAVRLEQGGPAWRPFA